MATDWQAWKAVLNASREWLRANNTRLKLGIEHHWPDLAESVDCTFSLAILILRERHAAAEDINKAAEQALHDTGLWDEHDNDQLSAIGAITALAARIKYLQMGRSGVERAAKIAVLEEVLRMPVNAITIRRRVRAERAKLDDLRKEGT